ncbi:NAD dependent epimerase/dehydratase [Dothidotthia symphoricarpi CBS 119687]|uniref:NAD dependent epimerase/dehydratase n=1 Tax=Dothidotthia symphoricarpi CBS 119687 TaxID=1392245 RepID=A0A6A6A453_9PLEO|nr:NAD dependent epimerase/dehydratase [Dothidotthia symphoricarpi CBS 119687]KAF2126669.1 NAD dependent epimerase/dehydratase [Dothidotthia symphoricarpi CBS 119687]
MSQSKHIFITGGSGYIGSVVISFAIQQGYTIHALSRSEASDDKLRALGATPIRGDLTTHSILMKAARDADIVISFADAKAGNWAMTQEERLRTNNAAVQALANGLEGSNKTLIVTSGSLLVSADAEGKETDEETTMWPNSPFGQGGEPFALGLGKKKGIRVCVVRLAPWVYGRGGSGVKLFMGRFSQAGEVFYVGEGNARTTTVHVDDAARLYLLVAEKGRAGEVYNATWETSVSFREKAESMAMMLGIPVRSQSFGETEKKMGVFLANFLSLENRASNRKARQELGWEIRAEKGILEDIKSGSYLRVAEELRKATA